MPENDIINTIYSLFNSRQADAILAHFHNGVQWPNGWEGGIIHGKDAVREYWLRQWSEINPIVTPVTITTLNNGRVSVNVHQVVKDLKGMTIFDGVLDHIYTFRQGLVEKMEIA
ncbi:ketosteroid isomerase [Flavipsychrobacter stenotrophus]|uniref:Ketosteroid isomerase n=1 Tax=Flavipsychrobacter stenotrophus TaxID=2077091 RepID=A0A2S7ST96_9BACT|nr:nuclear transport factor 2 family protein [Flavipsychrobacter stenotrophus]PQJ09746.1 ketosteroid isomerase [Flavipsychrobacter stenotrophus]